MPNNIADQAERERALDPHHSFIVKAPAGSGKTELLTQRFLLLLGTVRHPEEILAMTFTRKAAAEMRARILAALKNAEEQPEPVLAHAKKTWQLAKAVLAQDTRYQWHLMATPSRLRIQTLDSLNSYLTRQLPVLSQFGTSPDVTDQPLPLYQKAIAALLSNTHCSHELEILLLHCDNNMKKVTELLVNLLEKRDQWLPHLIFDPTNARHHLEYQLRTVIEDILKKVHTHFPKDKTQELLTLLHFAADNLLYTAQLENVDKTRDQSNLSHITECLTLEHLPDTRAEDKKYWLAISELFFTKSEDWRKRFDKNIGFPVGQTPAEKAHCAQMKKRMIELIKTIADNHSLKNAFAELRTCPDAHYTDPQWHVLAALQILLKLSVAELHYVFQKESKIDYTENALAALRALGDADAPTDLTLALDCQIRHILVDEFQDTSTTQYRLLEKLTAGWETNDGRTLFLVGDPCQSIYRFREAEVGLFIRTQQYGIGSLRPIPLALTVNFRSTAPIVHWINQHFSIIFPKEDDISTGAVAFSLGIASKETQSNDSPVTLLPCNAIEPQQQANELIHAIKTQQANFPDESITLLVRSRSHLAEIIPALRQAKIAYSAIDIDSLADRPTIQDILALTRALMDPADRIAWLALLRAPWCGLTLADLLLLSSGAPHKLLIENLQNQHIIQLLPDTSQQRLARVMDVMKVKLYQRNRFSLRDWVESTWLLLGGPACVATDDELADVESYFLLLQQYTHSAEFPDPETLEEAVSLLFSTAKQKIEQKVQLQIMTIHSAKGLEFDTVILPHMEKVGKSDDRDLLVWMERTDSQTGSALLMAPFAAMGAASDKIYDYVRRQHAIRSTHELSRLLYVALTRAKRKIILLFNQPELSEKKNNASSDHEKITRGSLLACLWPAIRSSVSRLSENTMMKKNNHVSEEKKPFIFRRLTADWQNPITEIRTRDRITFHAKDAGFYLPDNTAKYIGIVTHEIIRQLCEQGSHWWQVAISQKTKWITQKLLQTGLAPAKIPAACQQIMHAITQLLNDPRGQWIIQPHDSAASELALTAVIKNKPSQFVIDRTFVDEKNRRWIIDYKITQPTEIQTLADFLIQEQEKYAPQLENYQIAIKNYTENKLQPIRLALYFPLIPAWCEWEIT